MADEMNLLTAINRTLHQEMEADDRVMVLGEDVGVDGGIFRVTEGLLDRFGEDRVVDTPLAESAIVGTSIGLSIAGFRPVAEMQFSGFSYFGFYQLEGHAARMRTRTRGRLSCPMVVRMPYGAGVHALEHHSESKEMYYAHTPGLKTVIPSTPRTARGLLFAAIRDPDPVIYMEPKLLYRKAKQTVDEDEEYLVDIGKARVVKEGDDLTLVSYGAMLHTALQAAERIESEDGGRTVEVIDLLTMAPFDEATVLDSVKKTGRVVVVNEAHSHGGMAGEVLGRVAEKAILHLEAPPARVTGYDVQVPLFSREHHYMPDADRVVKAATETLEFA